MKKMRIGVDISQMAYEGTGVGEFVKNLVENLLKIDKKNEYVLFASSLRQRHKFFQYYYDTRKYHSERIKLIILPFPSIFLDFLWNRLHIIPVEWLIGNVDVFISSDWTQPPTKAYKATILYDLIVYKYPQETDKKIVDTQKRKLEWVKKECDVIFCISQASKQDAMEILGIEEKRLKVIYPGVQS